MPGFTVRDPLGVSHAGGIVRDSIKMKDDGFQQGWNERNGGNLSYRLKEEEMARISNRLNDHTNWESIGASVLELAGECFRDLRKEADYACDIE